MKKFLGLIALSGVVAASNAAGTTLAQWNFNQYTAGSGTAVNNPAASSGVDASTAAATVIGGTAAYGLANAGDSSSNASSDPNQTTGASWSVGSFEAAGTNSGVAGVEFAASTAGYSNVSFTFDQRWTAHSSEFGQLQYTINGTTWLNATTANGVTTTSTYSNGVIDGLFTRPGNGTVAGNSEGFTDAITYNFSGVAAANNDAAFAIREVAIFAPGTTDYSQAEDGFNGQGTNPDGDKVYGGNSGGRWKFDEVTFSAQPAPEPITMGLMGLGLVAAVKRVRKNKSK